MPKRLIPLLLVVFAFVAPAKALGRQKQVLVLFSGRHDAQLAVIIERQVPKLLVEGLKENVDYYTEYMDSPRFTQPVYQNAYLEFLRLKYTGKTFDLLIVVGSAAIDFMTRNRNVMFAGTPVVCYALEWPTARMPNSTGLVNPLHFNQTVDLALALQPGLKHLYVVSGAGPTDRLYERRARAEFLPFEHRLEFTYLSGLATEDLEHRLGTLPPQSAVYVVLVTQDGAGENFQQMDYLSRVAAAASAPTYSWADTSLESGIVGGHRRDQQAEIGVLAALALRVLRGERPDDIPVSTPATDVDQVDWRQLRRWGISEARLPAGTRVQFRQTSVWDRYKRYIIGSVALMLAQTALIAALLLQSALRRRAEQQVRVGQDQLRASYDRIRHLGGRLLRAQEDERSRIARELHDDIGQQVTVLALKIEQFRMRGPLRRTADRLVDGAVDHLHHLARSVQALSHRLHPGKLQLVGLVDALDGLARELSRPDLSIAFAHDGVPPVLPTDVSLHLFRVVQEGLQNAMKHSGARHVSVQMSNGPFGLALTIADDGVGFDVKDASRQGLGLVSMVERLELIGGSLKVVSQPGAGTRLEIQAPIRAAAESDVTSPSQGAIA